MLELREVKVAAVEARRVRMRMPPGGRLSRVVVAVVVLLVVWWSVCGMENMFVRWCLHRCGVVVWGC